MAELKSLAPANPDEPRKPAPQTHRTPPPKTVPLRDRLLCVLQPPVAVLLGDNRLWLPFEPFPYQYEGISFLTERWSAILADEMGLGKTMQTIMAMRLLIRSGQVQSVLLVCPKPLVTNWLREFRLWAEEIAVTPIQGETWVRHNQWEHDRSPIKIVNYESLIRDVELFSNQTTFDLVVIDEAQRIKNRDSKVAKVMRSIRRKRSWALTGTPVENRAADLESILGFVRDCSVDHGERLDLLREELNGIFLRRTKDLVQTEMPEKVVHDVYIDLGANQRQRYDAAEKDGVFRLNDLGDEITIEHVFELIRRLKQICNFDPVTGESAKADQLLSDLEEITASGQKAIVFSQWVGVLEHLADRVKDYRPLLYHGKVPSSQRDNILTEFKESKDRPILLLSYGSGAVGLNLQFSNYVYLFDRWWNPAIEDQAINRAHRIGQKAPVFVTRFVCPGTIEERIAAVLQQKRELFSSLIDDHDGLDSTGLTRDEVFGLFDLKVRPRT